MVDTKLCLVDMLFRDGVMEKIEAEVRRDGARRCLNEIEKSVAGKSRDGQQRSASDQCSGTKTSREKIVHDGGWYSGLRPPEYLVRHGTAVGPHQTKHQQVPTGYTPAKLARSHTRALRNVVPQVMMA